MPFFNWLFGRARNRTDESDKNASVLQTVRELEAQGKHKQAIALLVEASEASAAKFGEDSVEFETYTYYLGFKLNSQGNPEQAVPLLESVVELRRRRLGDGDPDFLQSLELLGTLYAKNNNYQSAEPCYREAVAIRSRKDKDLAFTKSADWLALSCVELKKYEEAASLFQECLELRRRFQGDDHREVKETLDSLGSTYRLMGDEALNAHKHTEAVGLYTKAAELLAQGLGDYHTKLGACMSALGASYDQLGDYGQAKRCIQRAIDIESRIGGKYVGALYYSLGNLLKRAGEIDESNRALLEAKRLGFDSEAFEKGA